MTAASPVARGYGPATADYMGMLATVMNALAGCTMDKRGLTRVMSAISIEQVVEPYVRPKALQYLEILKVVVFAAGWATLLHHRYCRCAARRIGAGWCSKPPRSMACTADPHKDPSATRYTTLSFGEAMVRNLGIMDATALPCAVTRNCL